MRTKDYDNDSSTDLARFRNSKAHRDQAEESAHKRRGLRQKDPEESGFA